MAFKSDAQRRAVFAALRGGFKDGNVLRFRPKPPRVRPPSMRQGVLATMHKVLAGEPLFQAKLYLNNPSTIGFVTSPGKKMETSHLTVAEKVHFLRAQHGTQYTKHIERLATQTLSRLPRYMRASERQNRFAGQKVKKVPLSSIFRRDDDEPPPASGFKITASSRKRLAKVAKVPQRDLIGLNNVYYKKKLISSTGKELPFEQQGGPDDRVMGQYLRKNQKAGPSITVAKLGYHNTFRGKKMGWHPPQSPADKKFTLRHEIGHHVFASLPYSAKKKIARESGLDSGMSDERTFSGTAQEEFADAYALHRKGQHPKYRRYHEISIGKKGQFRFRMIPLRMSGETIKRQRSTVAYALRQLRKLPRGMKTGVFANRQFLKESKQTFPKKVHQKRILKLRRSLMAIRDVRDEAEKAKFKVMAARVVGSYATTKKRPHDVDVHMLIQNPGPERADTFELPIAVDGMHALPVYGPTHHLIRTSPADYKRFYQVANKPMYRNAMRKRVERQLSTQIPVAIQAAGVKQLDKLARAWTGPKARPVAELPRIRSASDIARRWYSRTVNHALKTKYGHLQYKKLKHNPIKLKKIGGFKPAAATPIRTIKALKRMGIQGRLVPGSIQEKLFEQLMIPHRDRAFIKFHGKKKPSFGSEHLEIRRPTSKAGKDQIMGETNVIYHPKPRVYGQSIIVDTKKEAMGFRDVSSAEAAYAAKVALHRAALLHGQRSALIGINVEGYPGHVIMVRRNRKPKAGWWKNRVQDTASGFYNGVKPRPRKRK